MMMDVELIIGLGIILLLGLILYVFNIIEK